MTARHPGGEAAALRLVEMAGITPPCRLIDLGAGAGGTVLAPPFPPGSFDAALCECAFFLSGAPERALLEAARLLRPGGALLFSDVCPGGEPWLRRAAERAGFRVGAVEDITDEWKRYYISALWRGEAEYPPEGAKNCRYLHAVLRKEDTA